MTVQEKIDKLRLKIKSRLDKFRVDRLEERHQTFLCDIWYELNDQSYGACLIDKPSEEEVTYKTQLLFKEVAELRKDNLILRKQKRNYDEELREALKIGVASSIMEEIASLVEAETEKQEIQDDTRAMLRDKETELEEVIKEQKCSLEKLNDLKQDIEGKKEEIIEKQLEEEKK